MAWRLARSLETLRAEVNAIAPGRSKASDGTIGDAAHSGRASDHNPNSAGVVCALDLTHDPGAGADMHRIAEHIRTQRHPALKYVIWNRRIASASSGWAWRAYSGSNPHTKHMHVSVGIGSDGRSTGPYDNTSSWGLVKEDDVSTKDVLAALRQRQAWISEGVGEYATKDQAGPKFKVETSQRSLLEYTWHQGHLVHNRDVPELRGALARIEAALAEAAGRDPVNEQEIVDGVLAGLGGKDLDEAVAALAAAFGDRAAELAAKLAAATAQSGAAE